jgi:hypothetical protein
MTVYFVVYTLAVKKNQGRFRHVGSDHSLVRYGRWSVWFPSISTELSPPRGTEVLTSSKIHSFTRIFWRELSSPCWSTTKSLIAAYIYVFTCPHRKESRGLPIDWVSTSYPLFRLCPTMQREWSDAPPSTNHIRYRWQRGICSKSIDKSFTQKNDDTVPCWRYLLRITDSAT